MEHTPLRVRAPRMLIVKNRNALLFHLLDRIDEGHRDLVITFDQTHYVDSSGLGMLVEVHRFLVREMGGRLRLSGLDGELCRLLQATRLDRVLELTDEAEGETDPWRAPEDWSAGPVVAEPLPGRAALAVAGSGGGDEISAVLRT
jgi:anti-sigma B factor antagonist